MWVKEIFFTALLVWSLTCLIKDLLLYWQEYSCLLSKLYYRKSLINSTSKFVIHTSQMSILLHQCYVPLSPTLPDPKVSNDACWQEQKMVELGIRVQHPAFFTSRSLMAVFPPPPHFKVCMALVLLISHICVTWSLLVYNSTSYSQVLWYKEYVLCILDICFSFCFALKLLLSDFHTLKTLAICL